MYCANRRKSWFFQHRSTAVGAVLSLCLSLACAQPKPDEARPPGRGGPPPEALAACKAAKEGTACKFKSDRGEVSGQFAAPPDRPLACHPLNAPDAGPASTPPSKK